MQCQMLSRIWSANFYGYFSNKIILQGLMTKTKFLCLVQWIIKHNSIVPYQKINQLSIFSDKKDIEWMLPKGQVKPSKIISSVVYAINKPQFPHTNMGPTITSFQRLLHMLCIGRDEPWKSTCETPNGKHNFNAQSLVPPGCNTLLHIMGPKRNWCMVHRSSKRSPSMLLHVYHGHQACKGVTFLPKVHYTPKIQPRNYITQIADELLAIIKLSKG